MILITSTPPRKCCWSHCGGLWKLLLRGLTNIFFLTLTEPPLEIWKSESRDSKPYIIIWALPQIASNYLGIGYFNCNSNLNTSFFHFKSRSLNVKLYIYNAHWPLFQYIPLIFYPTMYVEYYITLFYVVLTRCRCAGQPIVRVYTGARVRTSTYAR